MSDRKLFVQRHNNPNPDYRPPAAISPRVLYLCDQRACQKCGGSPCKHTLDISHAKNFVVSPNGTYIEKKENDAGEDGLLKALGRLKVETGSLVCLGCGYEHNCSTQGCAIIRAACRRISLQAADIADMDREVDRLHAQLRGKDDHE